MSVILYFARGSNITIYEVEHIPALLIPSVRVPRRTGQGRDRNDGLTVPSTDHLQPLLTCEEKKNV